MDANLFKHFAADHLAGARYSAKVAGRSTGKKALTLCE